MFILVGFAGFGLTFVGLLWFGCFRLLLFTLLWLNSFGLCLECDCLSVLCLLVIGLI